MTATLITGAAGFIGYHLSKRLLARGDHVVGVDNFNSYYTQGLKEARAANLASHENFRLIRADIADAQTMAKIFERDHVARAAHLAAQAGVRYSLQNPFAYERSNLAGHLSVLEAARNTSNFEHLVYASSSSVYGDRPLEGAAFREEDPADAPASLYAATKRACELMSSSYSRLYGLGQSGLRFFTVYGPWGRPDMAYFSFTRSIMSGEPIDVYGGGQMQRDFTYVDDIVDGVLGVLDRPAKKGENQLLNIGNNRPEGLMTMIELLEQSLSRRATKRFREMQPGDVTSTWADTSKINALTGYSPRVSLSEGIPRFVSWYQRWAKDLGL